MVGLVGVGIFVGTILSAIDVYATTLAISVSPTTSGLPDVQEDVATSFEVPFMVLSLEDVTLERAQYVVAFHGASDDPLTSFPLLHAIVTHANVHGTTTTVTTTVGITTTTVTTTTTMVARSDVTTSNELGDISVTDAGQDATVQQQRADSRYNGTVDTVLLAKREFDTMVKQLFTIESNSIAKMRRQRQGLGDDPGAHLQLCRGLSCHSATGALWSALLFLDSQHESRPYLLVVVALAVAWRLVACGLRCVKRRRGFSNCCVCKAVKASQARGGKGGRRTHQRTMSCPSVP